MIQIISSPGPVETFDRGPSRGHTGGPVILSAPSGAAQIQSVSPAGWPAGAPNWMGPLKWAESQ